MGCIIPEKVFIKGLRELCDQEDILLIFDEVMTRIQIGKGWCQESIGINGYSTLGGNWRRIAVGAFAAEMKLLGYFVLMGQFTAGRLSEILWHERWLAC